MRKLVSLLACLILLVTPLPAAALSPSSSTVYDGIDVSHWQGDIDFGQVASSGISIVYIKSSEGTGLIDPYFEINYSNAKANGLSVGFYHYLTAVTTDQAAAEAQFFASLVADKDYDCLLAMDYEAFDESLDPAGINAIAAAFLEALAESSEHDSFIIYSDINNAANVFSLELAAAYPLWVADYSGALPETAGGWNAWTGFQYTETGSVSGITGNVDRSQFTSVVLLPSSVPPGGDNTSSSGGEIGGNNANGSSDGSGSDSGSTGGGDSAGAGNSESLQFSFTIPLLMSLTAVFTVAVGGGGLGLGIYVAKRTHAPEPSGMEGLEDGSEAFPDRSLEIEEIREIEELELLELQNLQEERRIRLQEQRQAREQQELEELRILQRKAQELQEELWALKEKALQDPQDR